MDMIRWRGKIRRSCSIPTTKTAEMIALRTTVKLSPVAGSQHGAQHGLEEERITHPLGHNHIHL